MTSTSKAFRRLLRNDSGNTAIVYALSAIPLMLAVGAGIDFVRFADARTHLQSALDAAALAGAAAAGKTDDERVAIAEAAFEANMASGAASDYPLTKTFDVISGTLVTEATADMPMSLMKVAGIDEFPVTGSAEVDLTVDRKAEIALVLDYSGSMQEVSGTKVKYVAMREAADKLVNDLTTASPGKIKFGLVPFSHQVYVTLDKSFVLGTTGTGTWTGCTQDRRYPNNLTDDTPTVTAATKWNQPMAPDHASWGCGGYAPRNLVVRPLTSNSAAVRAQLVAMTPYAWTHIALGVEFGYHLLSPNAPFAEGVSYTDDETRKFMVVLTDGMQTEPAFGPGATRNVPQGESNLEDLCDNAKADGITIITLAFDLNDTSTRARLKYCATGDDNFFIADDDADLTAAFEAIKVAIASDIYLKK